MCSSVVEECAFSDESTTSSEGGEEERNIEGEPAGSIAVGFKEGEGCVAGSSTLVMGDSLPELVCQRFSSADPYRLRQ